MRAIIHTDNLPEALRPILLPPWAPPRATINLLVLHQYQDGSILVPANSPFARARARRVQIPPGRYTLRARHRRPGAHTPAPNPVPPHPLPLENPPMTPPASQPAPRHVRLRHTLGLSQRRIAAYLGTYRQTVCRWEAAEPPPLYLRLLETLAELQKTDPAAYNRHINETHSAF